MTHGTEQHLEHAEHAQHAAHNPFDRQVAMTVAIIAAALAGVTMLSHRSHNETLRLETEAAIYHTRASNEWNYYQAKNNASRQMQNFIMTAEFLPANGDQADAREKAIMVWKKQVDKYEGDGFWAYQVANSYPGDMKKNGKKVKGGQLAKLQKNAEGYASKATKLESEGHHVHQHVNWLDFGHLGLELALVLCSVSILSKQRWLWVGGISVAVIGGLLALYAVYGLYIVGPGH
jgi:hypothetical protein